MNMNKPNYYTLVAPTLLKINEHVSEFIDEHASEHIEFPTGVMYIKNIGWLQTIILRDK